MFKLDLCIFNDDAFDEAGNLRPEQPTDVPSMISRDIEWPAVPQKGDRFNFYQDAVILDVERVEHGWDPFNSHIDGGRRITVVMRASSAEIRALMTESESGDGENWH